MDSIRQWFEELWANKTSQAALIVVGSLVAGILVNWLVTGTVLLWARRTRWKLDEQLVSLLHGPIVKTVVLVGLWVATARIELDEKYAEPTRNGLLTVGLLVWTVLTFRVSALLLRLARENRERFSAVRSQTLPLFSNLSKLVLAGISAYLLIVIWDIDATGWMASAGIVGVAVGFAAKDTLANLFAGVFVIADAPYRVGDFIVLGSGERGQVNHIGLRSTRILTRDDIEITIPNSIIASSMVTNETGGPYTKRRVRVKVQVAYGSDVDRVREVLCEIPQNVEWVCESPAHKARFRGFGDSGLNFELLCWIDEPVLRGRTLDALNTAVYKRFMKEGIEIPYPKRDLYVREMPQSS